MAVITRYIHRRQGILLGLFLPTTKKGSLSLNTFSALGHSVKEKDGQRKRHTGMKKHCPRQKNYARTQNSNESREQIIAVSLNDIYG